MKKLHEIRLFMYSFGLLLSSALERTATNIINGYLNLFEENIIIYHTLSMVLLIVFFIVTNIAIKKLIGTKFVSKMVFGKKYVGGHWIELVYCKNDAGKIEFSHYCDLEIGYDIDKIYLSGTDYDKNYGFMYNLETESASMENYGLSYIYTCQGGDIAHRKGHGSLHFHKKDYSRPDRYSGRFKGENNVDYSVEGFLIDKKADIKGLNKDFITTFDRILRERKRLIIAVNEIANIPDETGKDKGKISECGDIDKRQETIHKDG